MKKPPPKAWKRRGQEALRRLEVLPGKANVACLKIHLVSQRAEEMLGQPVNHWLSKPSFLASLLHAAARDLALRLKQDSQRKAKAGNQNSRCVLPMVLCFGFGWRYTWRTQRGPRRRSCGTRSGGPAARAGGCKSRDGTRKSCRRRSAAASGREPFVSVQPTAANRG